MKDVIKYYLENTDLPVSISHGSEKAVGFDISASYIRKVFKGDVEVSEEKLKRIQDGFEKRGYIKLRPMERILFGTGIYISDMTEDTELQVRSRSGLSLKRGLIVLNSPGTIDPDYRGEIGVILYNSTPFLNKVERFERVAQLVPNKIIRPEFILSETINQTERGGKGYGSTGTK